MRDFFHRKHRLSRTVSDNPFLRNSFLIGGGTVLGQLAPLIASPILTRIYQPNDFGVFAIYASIIAIVSVFVNLKFDSALSISRSDKDAEDLWSLSLISTVVVGLMIGVATVFSVDYLFSSFGSTQKFLITLLLPMGVVISGIYQTLSMSALRSGRALTIGQTRAYQGLGAPFFQISISLLRSDGITLAAGQFFGQALGIYSLWRRNTLKGTLELQSLKRTALKYRSFPLIFSSSAVFNILALQLPIILVAQIFGVSQAGLFAIAIRLLGTPVDLLCNVVGQTFLIELNRIKSEGGSLKSACDQLIRRLIPVSFGVLLFGLSLSLSIGALFGDSWSEAGPYILVLLPYLSIKVIGSPLTQLLVFTQKLSWLLPIDIARAATITIMFFITKGQDLVEVLLIYSLCMFAYYLVYILVSRHAADVEDRTDDTLKTVVKHANKGDEL